MNMQSPEFPWRILAAHSNSGLACHDDGTVREVHFRRRSGRPAAGDFVALDVDGAVSHTRPRTNLFQRGAWGGRPKPVAANLDRLLILVAPEPYPSRDLVQRYLAAAFILGIPPALVHTKLDLANDGTARLTAHLGEFTHLGLPRHDISCETGEGIEPLLIELAGDTSLLVGQSGVGKSTLLNRLIPDLDSRTAKLSRVTGKGTHTTTTCTLHELPAGGWVGDTPGVWEFSLWAMSEPELELGFPEFSRIGAGCKFRNCRHLDEPGCAIRAAADAGILPSGRYSTWKRLVGEQKRLKREG